MKSLLTALLLIAGVHGAVQAQHVFRCGSTFSQYPCNAQPTDAADPRPMLRDNETVQQFAERQVRYLEERGRLNGTRVSASSVEKRARQP
jgi:hypothetical protein